jgi:hypothetical protein
MLCEANIHATASRMMLFQAMKKEAVGSLGTANEELEWVQQVLKLREINTDTEDFLFHHAAYADELVALAIADTQLDQMTNVLDGDSDNSDSDEEDDLVYKDRK